MITILQKKDLNKFVSIFFKEWLGDIFSVVLVSKKKKIVCILNGIKQYEFNKKEVLNALYDFF